MGPQEFPTRSVGFGAMGARSAVMAVGLTTVLLLAGCERSSSPTGGEVALGASVEQARGHLAAAVANAESGAWDLAAAHTGHPAELLPTIDRMVSSKDAAVAAALRTGAADAVRAAGARDLSALRTTVTDLDRQLAAVPALVMGSARAGEARYQASVMATLVGVVAEEYREGVDGGRVVNVVEYQDAHAFLQRALASWRAVEPAIGSAATPQREIAAGLTALSAAMPAIAAPASPAAPEEVATAAHDVQRGLREAVGAEAGKATASTSEVETARATLAAATTALRAGDAAAAGAAFRDFRSSWIRIEDAVRGYDRDAYRRVESDMAALSTLFAGSAPDVAAAAAGIARIDEALAPVAASTPTYGIFDATIILLREGLEALLVIAALLAFLARSGNADKQRWVWAGSAAGVAVSIAVAVTVTLAVSASSAAGIDPELLEGITGIVAGVMLVYVSYWLHSKADLRKWDRWLRDRSARALARNSLLSLGLIAFLAVLREGSETVLFYLGIASSIAIGDLLLGLAAGTAALAVAGVLMIGLGVRLPVRPFFLGTSVLVYYLAFKFLGSGIHALQVVGLVRATPADTLPDIGVLGMFPTWETTAVQLALLAAAALVLMLRRGSPSLPSTA